MIGENGRPSIRFEFDFDVYGESTVRSKVGVN